jgi:2-iminobutanoate/2-iminopropanoate deaminase
MRGLKLAVLLLALVPVLSAQSSGSKQFVRPPAGQTPPYSPAIRVGNIVYVSGMLPTDAKGQVVGTEIRAQTKQVFENIRAALQQAGSSLDQTVNAVVMLQNPADFPALDEVYRTQFKGEPPARTTIMGQMVREGALLEIHVTAVANGVARKAILPPGWMKPTSPYNYGILAGDTLWLSGMVSRNGKDNTQVQGDVRAQTKVAMDNVGEVLKAAGMGYGDLVAGRVAFRDITKFNDVNEVYRSYWEKDRPARISCQAAPPGTYDVEITFVAIKGTDRREVIVPPAADGSPGTIGPNFSPAIKVGNRLFVSGTTGTTDANKGDMKAQTAETLARLGRSFKVAGFDYKDVVQVDVFITDVKKFNDMNEGYRPVFPTDPPVRATVGVDRVNNINALAEIQLMAHK